MRFDSKNLGQQLGGEVLGPDTECRGVSIDSRSIAPGNLFVPIVAERDGHDFVPAAVGAGAVAYLSANGRIGSDATAISVADTTAALTELGRVARKRLRGPVIGVTGSVGKTSVKDLTLAACASTKVAHASEKSFNNELGVPLTLANAPDDVDVVILEMGARGVGHIAVLCEIGRPTIGVVTTVALAHSELFGSIEGVAAAKGELIQALPSSGTAILNAENPYVAAMASLTDAAVVTFGTDSGDVRAVNIILDESLRPRFTIESPAGRADVALEARGAHMALNAAAAVAAALAAGVDLANAVAGLGQAVVSPWRMEVDTSPSGLIVINDAYNANPTSMRAALAALCETNTSERIAVIGEMAELGVEGPAEHEAIAAEAAALGVHVIAVAAPAYGTNVEHVADRSAALAALGTPGAGSAVLIKASRVAGLELLAADLLA